MEEWNKTGTGWNGMAKNGMGDRSMEIESPDVPHSSSIFFF